MDKKTTKPSSEPGVNSSNYGQHLFNKMTVSEFFSDDRHTTEKILGKILTKIGPHLRPNDFDILYDTRLVALPVNMLATVIPEHHEDQERPASVFVSPLIETTGGQDEEAAECDLAGALAEAVASTKNTSKPRIQIDTEARALLASWDYS